MKRGTRNLELGTRRAFLKRAALVSTGLIWVPKHLAAQTTVTADGLADFTPDAAPAGGGDITTGLVGLWTLNDNAANTTVADSSGNANDGIASVNSSVLHATGQISGAFLLNGTSQYVALPNAVATALDGGSECTLCGYFKGSLIQSMIRIQPSGGNFIILGWGTSSPQAIMSNDGSTSGVAIAGVQDGNWHHVAMTWKQNTTNGFKVYVDKILSAQRTSSNSSLSVTAIDAPALGRYNGASPGEYMSGTIDDCRVYSRALTATDIAALP